MARRKPTAPSPTTRRIFSSSTTTSASACCSRAISATTASASPSPRNAAEARQRLAGLAFDLLIVDVMMPGEDGMALVKSLRETMNVPILMLTARAESRQPHRRASNPAPTTIWPSRSSRASCCSASTTSYAAPRRPATPLIEQVALRAVHLQPRAARTEARRRAGAPDRPRAPDHGDLRRRARARPCRATS